MDILNAVLILSIFIIIFYLGKKLFNPVNKEVKSPKRKKEEIINEYEEQMKEVLTMYKNDDNILKLKKTQLLKQISTELSTNIFFDKQEVRDVIQKLVNMH